MDNNLLQIKVKERLNKLSSEDYDNLECWQIAEAFNKAQIEWCRKQIHGNNLRQEGDESTKMLIDDMQPLLTNIPLGVSAGSRLYRTDAFPDNYLWFKRVEAKSSTDCCSPRNMKIHLEEEADIEEMLSDDNSKPSIEWNETFCTLTENAVNIYTNDLFSIEDAKLHYYRLPVSVEFEGCVHPSDDTLITTNVECEFKKDIVEMLIDHAVSILAGDMELFNSHQLNKQNAEKTN